MTEYNIDTPVTLKEPENYGDLWDASQDSLDDSAPNSSEAGNPHNIDWDFGPIVLKGFVDSDSDAYDVSTMVVIMGINLGIINGNLKDGTGIKFKLHKAQGDIKLYLKNGNEVWVHTDVRVRFGGSYDRDMKLLSM